MIGFVLSDVSKNSILVKSVHIINIAVKCGDCGSPKGCFCQASTVGMLSEEEVENTLRMCDDRNLTSHTYIEAIATQIYHRLPQYSMLLEKLQLEIGKRVLIR